jgi:glycosyltransferase involved in cell wall biosynthesis
MDNYRSGDLNISVIVPVKNSVRTIRDLLDSLMELDYDSDMFEVILVDGDSTDGTRKIIQEYPVILLDEEGHGLNAARNTGIKWSSGEIIAFTDGDCIVPPDWLRNMAKNFRDPNVSFVGGPVQGYDGESFLSVYMDETYFQVKPGFTWRSEATDLMLLQFPAGCNMAFRRHALEKVNFFDERIAFGFDDLDPVEKLGSRGFRMVMDPEVVVLHQHRTSLRDIFKQHFNYGRGGALLIVYKRASKLARWFTNYLFTSIFSLSLVLMLIGSGLFLGNMFTVQFGLGFVSFGLLILMLFYAGVGWRTGRLRKMILYPLIDVARGLFFTFGGLTQLLKMLMGRSRRAENF